MTMDTAMSTGKFSEQRETPRLAKRRASTPRTQIKTVRWRGDVIEVVNRFFVKLKYEPVPRLRDPGWMKTWQKSVERSIAEINAGQSRVHKSTQSFLDALDDS